VPLVAMALTHDNLSHPAEYDRKPLLSFGLKKQEKTPPSRLVATTKVCGRRLNKTPPAMTGLFLIRGTNLFLRVEGPLAYASFWR
jgi:hypothetical protein